MKLATNHSKPPYFLPHVPIQTYDKYSTAFIHKAFGGRLAMCPLKYLYCHGFLNGQLFDIGELLS